MSVNFLVQLRRWLERHASWLPRLLAAYICGAAAFLVASIVMVPGYKLKNLQQLGAHKGFADAVRATWRAGGPLAFYNSFWSVCLRDIP